MPYAGILESLLAQVPGSVAAALVDAQGELVVGAGGMDDRQRLIGAYEGIALTVAARAARRTGAGAVRSLAWRHEAGTVLLVPLHDGYYLVLSLEPQALVALALRRCEEARLRLNAEI